MPPDQPADSTGTVAPTRAPSGRIARWKIVLFSAIAALLVVAVLEVSARVYLRITRGFDGEYLYQYAFDPYKNILPTPNFVDTRGVLRHNAQGFRRDTEVPRDKPDSVYRIFLMGGSTAYGIGGLWPHLQQEFAVLDNSETISAYLEQILDSHVPGRRIEVINAAITSTWTHHHLIYLNQTILGFDPDMVLFLDGFNDFYHFAPNHDQFRSYSYNLPSRGILGEPTLRSLLRANGWWLFRKSAAAHVLARVGRDIAGALFSDPDRSPLDVERALAGVRENFPANALKMHERSGLILEAEGVHAVFMLQPLLILERDRPGAPPIERELFEFNVAAARPNYEDFMERAVAFVRGPEAEMADRVGGTFIDLTQIFDGIGGQIYTDYAHLTPLGNRVMAEHIASQILRTIRGDLADPGNSPAP